MAPADPAEQARVSVAADQMSASLTLPAGLGPELLTVEFLAGLARERQVGITQKALKRLSEAIKTYKADPQTLTLVFAEGTPAQHGEHARLEWESGFDPEHHALAEGAARADFYNAVDYIRAAEGQTIARIVPATEGVDGMTVVGEVAKAKPGKALDWQLDTKSLEIVGAEVRARINGVVLVHGKHVSVSDLIEVTDVDFHTGNITVEGGVHVRSEVKDRFEIHATKDVIIDGLVESAIIECGGNLQLRRGMAAHDRGRLKVGGNAYVGYLNAVHARIKGDLSFHHELMNCELSVGGDVIGQSGAIIGGTTAAMGSICVGVLGSEAEIPTRVVLGSAPLLLEERAHLVRDVKHAESAVQELTNELCLLDHSGGKLSAPQKERLTEIHFHISEARQELTNKLARLEHVDHLMQEHARVDLHVQKHIHPKVALIVNGVEIGFKKKLHGPVRLGWDSNRRLVMKRDDGSFGELGQFVTVRKAA